MNENQLLEYFELVCQIIGVVVIAITVLFIFIRSVIFIYQLYSTRENKWLGGPHTWAVVTGASEGIGLAYAKQLAEKGYNLLLISRKLGKLLKVKQDILTKYGGNRKVRVLAIDFNTTNNDIYDKIRAEFESLDEIHVLVNNVGTNYPNERPEYLTQIPDLDDVIMNLVNVNVVACTRLTAMVLPKMDQKGRGIIINLSSFSAIYPTPLISLYSATKVYIDYMSRALQEEYRSRGIIIQSVLPYYVSTHMTNYMNSNFMIPTPDQFVKHAIKTVGREDRTAGYLPHKLWNLVWFWLGIGSQLFGIDYNIRFTFSRLRAVRARIHVKIGPIPPSPAVTRTLTFVQENIV